MCILNLGVPSAVNSTGPEVLAADNAGSFGSPLVLQPFADIVLESLRYSDGFQEPRDSSPFFTMAAAFTRQRRLRIEHVFPRD